MRKRHGRKGSRRGAEGAVELGETRGENGFDGGKALAEMFRSKRGKARLESFGRLDKTEGPRRVLHIVRFLDDDRLQAGIRGVVVFKALGGEMIISEEVA
jgi:hypothetical protein